MFVHYIPARVEDALRLADLRGWTPLGARRAVNAAFRACDESHLYPVRGRFNVTERAIRRVRRAERDGLVLDCPRAYAATVEAEASRIINAC